jgi:hypothetical protein
VWLSRCLSVGVGRDSFGLPALSNRCIAGRWGVRCGSIVSVGERAPACWGFRTVAGEGAVAVVREQRDSSSSLCLCLLLEVLQWPEGMQLAVFPEVAGVPPGGSFVVAAKSGAFQRKAGSLDRDDVFPSPVEGRWPW